VAEDQIRTIITTFKERLFICLEQGVPSGTWIYTDTPVLANWTGQESPTSAAVSVP
jgi:hypothetical protein